MNWILLPIVILAAFCGIGLAFFPHLALNGEARLVGQYFFDAVALVAFAGIILTWK
jgi:hypothetical protein